MKNKKLIKNTRILCNIAMLTAVAFVLGLYSVRVGLGIKMSFKFLPVFICAALYGPIPGGICGAASDAVSYIINPVGAYLWQYTLIEFLYGLSFGVFFKNSSGLNKTNIIKAFICITLNTVLLSIFANAYVLKDLINRGYIETIVYRMPSTLVNMLLRYVGIFVALKIMPVLRKAAGIENNSCQSF